MEQELKDLMKEQKAEREKLKTELEIKKLIQDKTLMPFKIYISNLYGVKAWITFKDEFRGEGVNKEELNKLLKLFKPTKTYLSGGNSLRPTENPKEDNKPINPYFIKWDGFKQELFINWFSELKKGTIMEIMARVTEKDFINEFLSVSFQRKEYKGYYRIENVQAHINGNFADGKYKLIRWGRGTEQYPNDFTLYTEDLNTDFKDYLNT